MPELPNQDQLAPGLTSPTDALGPAAWIMAQRRDAQAAALGGLEGDPQEAADALKIGETSNVPPALAGMDVEHYKKQQKAALISSLLENNPHLREYALGHPLAPQISSNDWGQLDSVSQAIQKFEGSAFGKAFHAPSTFLGAAATGFKEAMTSPGEHGIAAAKAGYGPFLTAVAGVADFPGQVFGGIIEGARRGVENVQTQLGADPNAATRRSNEFAALLEAELGGLSGRHAVAEPPKEMVQAFRAAKHYLDEDKTPPIGIDPLIDKLHAEQAKLDATNLSDLVKESSASQTRTLAPDFFADQFLRRRTNANILVDADAVRKLYGDKVPEAGDNLLGWVKGIQEQLAVAEEDGGGKVSIPVADWAAHVDPEVAKALKDDIQFRPGGVSLNEIKEQLKLEVAPELKPKEEAPELNPNEQVVSGLRQQTDLKPPLPAEAPIDLSKIDKGIVPDSAVIGQVLHGKERVDVKSFPVKDAISEIDRDRLTGVPRALAEFFIDRLDRMAGDTQVFVLPKQQMSQINPRLGMEVDTPGFYLPKEHAIVIADDIANGDYGHNLTTHILLHETAHAATVRAMVERPELRTNVRLLMDETDEYLSRVSKDVRDLHDYAFKNEEEFVAEAFSKRNFQEALATTPLSSELATKLGLHAKSSVWDAISKIVKDLIEKLTGLRMPDTILDGLMHLGPEFEKANLQVKEGKGGAFGAEPPPPDLSGKIARLLGKERGQRYLDSMAKRDAEDAEFQSKLAKQRATEQATAEWKANRASMRAQVAEDLKLKPQIAADNFFRTGELYGEKTRKPHLDRATVPADLREAIPPEYLADRGGIHPDAAASFFGYQTGRDMLEDMARLQRDRAEAGLTPSAHLTGLIEAQTDRAMERTYGKLEQTILEEAKDHILGPSELDRLHEEMMALNAIHLGEGAEMSAADQLKWNKAAVKSRVKENVAAGRYGTMGQLSSDHFLDLVGRLGRRIEDALQEGEAHDAFKLSQLRLINAHIAAEVKSYEKLQKQFETKVKNWRKREPSGLLQEDALWIHQILAQIGYPARRSVQDFEHQKELVSQHENLREYYNSVNKANGTNPLDPDAMPVVQNLNIMEDLFSSNWRKSVEDMTPEEFKGTFDSLKSIDNWGRNNRKSLVRGNKEDTNDVVNGLVERLKAAVADKPAAMTAHEKSVGRTIGSLLLNTETWFKRLDLGNRLGPFSQLIVRPITEGQYALRSMDREFAAMWRDLGEPKDFKAKIKNDLFRDQDGELIPMTRGNALAVLSNMGNKLQRAKMVLGWKIHEDVAAGEAKIWDWLQRVGIGPEDLARAQKLGKIFEEAFERAETTYAHLSGVAPARIELSAMQTPFGVTDEWYHPLIPDPLRKSVNLTADDMLNESGFYRPSPSRGYTKLRTGAVYPIDLSYEMIPFKLKQILNDAAMRIPITEVNKIVYHDAFQSAFKKYYGPEYFHALDAWMKDVAGNRQWVPGNLKSLDMAINALQRNLGTLLIGFNELTVAKHAPTAAVLSMREVGIANFTESLSHIIYELPGSKERWNFAMENSEELQNRIRNIQDTLIVANRELFSTKTGARKKIESFRDTVEKYGHYPVGYTDLYSAVAMWDAEYRRLGEEFPDMTHGDKVYSANTAVRQTHGSSILSNRPGIMRYHSPLARLAMPFYNFFNNVLQRNYELAWKAKLALQGRELPEMTGFTEEKFAAGPQHILPLMGGLMVFGVIPSLIEQMVDPLPMEKGESEVKHWAKILTRAYPSMIPVVRDIVNGVYTHHDPAIGLFGTATRDVAEALNPNTYVNNPGQAFQNANRAFGALTGLTFEHVGQAGKFTTNVMTGKEHPHGMGDLFRGMWEGTLKQKRK